LQGLFNVKKYLHEHKDKKSDDIVNAEQYKTLQDKVDAVMNRSKYNKVDLSSIFGFMKLGKPTAAQ